MDTNTPTTANTGAEAPVSWNVRYVTAEGFTAQLTLRGASGADVLTKAAAALKYLVAHGAQPDTWRAAAPPAAAAPAPDPSDPSWCPIHNVAMKRHERNGQVWYSHRDGEAWCRGGKGA